MLLLTEESGSSFLLRIGCRLSSRGGAAGSDPWERVELHQEPPVLNPRVSGRERALTRHGMPGGRTHHPPTHAAFRLADPQTNNAMFTYDTAGSTSANTGRIQAKASASLALVACCLVSS